MKNQREAFDLCEFEDWFFSEPHRSKYSKDHPAYLSAYEAWMASPKRFSDSDKPIGYMFEHDFEKLKTENCCVDIYSAPGGHHPGLGETTVDLYVKTRKHNQK